MTPERRAARRIVLAAEELYAAAKAYGLDVTATRALHAPLRMRVEAWLYRTRRESENWQAILRSPLFSRRAVAA